jgi:gluconate 2-dehydrogenase gamma chain
MYNSVMYKVTRRSFVSTLSAAPWLPLSALIPTAPQAGGVHPTSDCRYVFFDAAEARFVEAACERLLTAGAYGPSVHVANVAHYLDRQLSGPWGDGERLFRDGAWQPGTPSNVPPPFTPATLFRRALGAITLAFERRGTTFSALASDAQSRFLARLQSGGVELNGVPSSVFFDLLLKMTVEGFFGDPVRGATRDRVAWRVAGFPGAHSAPVGFRFVSTP